MHHALETVSIKALEASDIAVFIINNDGVIVHANACALKYLGYGFDELTSMHVWEIDAILNTPESYLQIRDSGTLHFETKHRSRSGGIIPVEVDVSIQSIEGERYSVAFVKDISQRRERDASLTLLKEMLDRSHDMIFILRIEDGYIDYANQTAIDGLGYTFERMRELGIAGFRRPLESDEPFSEHLQQLKKRGIMTDYAILIRSDGSEMPIEANVRYIEHDGVGYNIAIVRDIGERLEAQRQLQELNASLQNAVSEKTVALEKIIASLRGYKLAMDVGNIVSTSDLQGRITSVNDNFCRVTGYTREEVIGRPHSIVRHPDTPSEVFRALWSTISAKKVWHGILKNRKKDGSHYWVDIHIVPILDTYGEVGEYIAIRHDITELVAQRQIIEAAAKTDALTGLGNRYKLLNDIQSAASPSLALLNIDNFSEINDFYGHSYGDLLIIEVANTIEKVIEDRSGKLLYRLQADEFAILNLSLDAGRFGEQVRRIIQSVGAASYTIYDEEISVQMTASLSFDDDRATLFITANMAMKSAKKTQRNLLVYDDALGLGLENENNITWTKKLRNAIKDDRLVPYFQPIVNNATGAWEKYECLVRMIDEEGKVISPYFFLDIAKRTKHYAKLTRTVIRKSFEVFKSLDSEFSINLTIKDIIDPAMQEYIIGMLEQSGIGQKVVFEIVESEGIDNYEQVIAFIATVKSFGCKIAIDDFGTGYANFEYLMKLNADYIKIDGSLIKSLATDNNARVLVGTIINFARELGIKTVAEFVADETIYDIVSRMGIDYSQGYYFSPPLPEPRRSQPS